MDDLEDELDLRYHRGLNPEVYYRCPNSESLDIALRNELSKHAASVIPVQIVTEFIFSITSTLTIAVAQQPNMESIMEPKDYPQSMGVEYALCCDVEGKERLKLQRAIARSIIETIGEIDGFKYAERHATQKQGSDGVRFSYVCRDSIQNKGRKANINTQKKEFKIHRPHLPSYDCGGAVYIKFSIKRSAVHVVYKHSPIHNTPVVEETPLPALATKAPTTHGTANGTTDDIKPKKKKRKRKQKEDEAEAEDDARYDVLDLDTSTSAGPGKPSGKKRGRPKVSDSPEIERPSSSKKAKASKGKQPKSPARSKKKAPSPDPTPPPARPVKSKCARCREKGIKCNEEKPSCNQCGRGLWECQYDAPGDRKRSRNGCLNCKARKRKCGEEHTTCGHCFKISDDCRYADEV